MVATDVFRALMILIRLPMIAIFEGGSSIIPTDPAGFSSGCDHDPQDPAGIRRQFL